MTQGFPRLCRWGWCSYGEAVPLPGHHPHSPEDLSEVTPEAARSGRRAGPARRRRPHRLRRRHRPAALNPCGHQRRCPQGPEPGRDPHRRCRRREADIGGDQPDPQKRQGARHLRRQGQQPAVELVRPLPDEASVRGPLRPDRCRDQAAQGLSARTGAHRRHRPLGEPAGRRQRHRRPAAEGLRHQAVDLEGRQVGSLVLRQRHRADLADPPSPPSSATWPASTTALSCTTRHPPP